MKKILLALSILCMMLCLLVSCAEKEYDVTFSVDGVETTVTVPKGETPVYEGSLADKTVDGKTYRFAGWDAEIVAATADVTYTAVYKRVLTVSWVHALGTETTEILADEIPTPHQNALGDKMSDSTVYTFTGWDKALAAVSEADYDAAGASLVYNAQYTTAPRTYTITFKDGDTVLSSSAVDYGTVPSYTGTLADKTVDGKLYRFIGWNTGVIAVNGDATYTAVYKRVLTAKWVYSFGTETTEFFADTIPTPHETAAGDQMSDSTVYFFTGWDKTLAVVSEADYDALGGELVYNALYTTSPRSYIVTFKNGSEVVGTSSVLYGEKPIFEGTLPTKDGYNYCSFTNLDTPVESDGVVCEAFFTIYDVAQLNWALTRDNMSFERLDWEIAEERAINDNRGAVVDEAGGLVMLMLEYRNAPADSTFKAIAKAKVVESMKFLMSADAEAPMFSLEPYWCYNPLSALILLAKDTPDVWNELTPLEQEKYDFMMKCFTYIVNLGFADGNGYKTGPGYRGNFHKSWNSNYRLALLPVMLYAGEYFGGADAVDAILAAFSYDETMAKFAEYGWQRAIDEWSVTPPTFTKDVDGNTVPAYTMPSQKEMMENETHSGDIYYDRYSDGIPDDGGFGKGVRQPFKYNGVRLDNVAGIFNQLLTYNYSGGTVVSEVNCRPNEQSSEWTLAYILDGTKSPYEGYDGMMVELGKENRASCLYASEDFILVCVSLATFGEFDMYDITEDGLKNNLFYKTWIGNMDFLYKIAHGWQSFQTSSDPMSKPTYESDDKGQLLWRSWWEDNFGSYTIATLPYKDPFSAEIYDNNFNKEDFDVVASTQSVGDGEFILNSGSGGEGVYFKTVVDPTNPANKLIALGINKGSGGVNANLKVTGGLTAMGENTKLKISFKLAKDPEAEEIADSYMRFRDGTTTNVIKFFETVPTGAKVKFFGEEVANFSIDNTVHAYEMLFDFKTAECTLAIDGTVVLTKTMTLPNVSKADSLLNWPAETKASKFIFNWGIKASPSVHRGLLLDDLVVVSLPDELPQ